MRILHLVTNSDLGGAPRVVTELANSAAADGESVAVGSMPGGPMWDQLSPAVERFPLPRLRRPLAPFDDLATGFALGRLFRAWKPDVIHLHSSKIGVLGRLAAGRMADRTIYTIHGFDSIRTQYAAFLPLERLLAARCAYLVPVSEYDARNLAAAGIRGVHRLIRNGVTDRSATVASDAALAADLAARRASGRRVVLTVARLAAPKRFDLFLDVARLVPEADFLWIGNVQPVDPAALPANVAVLGEKPEAGDYAKHCDLFMLLSDFEGLPMSILEAMSAGVPVVASAVGGIAEAVDASVGAPVPNDAAAAAAAVKALLGDPARLAAAGAAARVRYLADFSAARCWREYRALYEASARRSR
jgi:glycosyltransferase involved in cell wall biosynthesis